MKSSITSGWASIFDIAAELPLELSNLVFQHLQLYELFRLQRVSRRWAAALFCIADSTVRSWEAFGEMQLFIPEGLSSSATLSLKAEHIDAFCNGDAFSMKSGHYGSYGPSSPVSTMQSVSYADGIIAWADAGIRTLHLQSGRSDLYVLEDLDDYATNVAVSSKIAAVITENGKCQIWEVATRSTHSFQIPILQHSASTCLLKVSGTTLVVLVTRKPTLDSSQTMTFACTWDLTTKEPHCFLIQEQDETPDSSTLNGQNIFIVGDGNSILYLQRDSCREGEPSATGCLSFTRFSISGHQILAEGTIEINGINQYSPHLVATSKLGRLSTVGALSMSLKPTQCLPRKTRYGIPVEIKVLRINFDSDRNELVQVVQNIDEYSKEFSRAYEHFRPLIPNFHFWKHIGYYRVGNAFEFIIKLSDVKKDTNREAEIERSRNILRASVSTFVDYKEWDSHSQLYGDEIFFIYADMHSFIVWCFDKNVTMADENQEYKQVRQIEKTSRSALIRQRTEAGHAATAVNL